MVSTLTPTMLFTTFMMKPQLDAVILTAACFVLSGGESVSPNRGSNAGIQQDPSVTEAENHNCCIPSQFEAQSDPEAEVTRCHSDSLQERETGNRGMGGGVVRDPGSLWGRGPQSRALTPHRSSMRAAERTPLWGPGMLTISHEHQGTVSAQETGPESGPDKARLPDASIGPGAPPGAPRSSRSISLEVERDQSEMTQISSRVARILMTLITHLRQAALRTPRRGFHMKWRDLFFSPALLKP
ncbi:hypothetical protein EYF80_028285 [Liparis tanakae]|uniref:Uncharacterized protein n=1 Tax=Liparis tanakae TaxID=230148 RepID=A0A4Z2H7R4_9TELE|nr:hypothetical protein EYF80_028285 [Liparis tanakae]